MTTTKYDGINPQFECWAIRDSITGHYLPVHWKGGTGYSYDRPTRYAFPRLFKSRKSAENALTAWLRGRFKLDNADKDNGGQGEGGHRQSWKRPPAPVKDATRIRQHMEVVRFTLTLQGQ